MREQLASGPDRWPYTPRAGALGVRAPRVVLLVWGAVCVLALPGLLGLTVEVSAQSVLDRSGPPWARYQQSLDVFGGDEVIVVAVELASPFDPAIEASIHRIGNDLLPLPDLGLKQLRDPINAMPVGAAWTGAAVWTGIGLGLLVVRIRKVEVVA